MLINHQLLLFIRVGCYGTWVQQWPCLNYRINELDLSKYTHVHYSFGDYYGNNVQLDKYASKQFEDFKSLAGVKKILSFGGWGISTDKGSYENMREMVRNAESSPPVIAKFATDNNLDGIDIDW